MGREERLAVGLVVVALFGHVLTGCEARGARVPLGWGDGGLEQRGLQTQQVRLCGPARHPEPPAELRGRCGPDLNECLEATDEPGECYYGQPGECAECVEHALLACATASGACDEDFGAIACCREAECPDGDGACLQRALLPGGACHATVARFEECARASARPGQPCERHRDACGPSLPLCYGTARVQGPPAGVEVEAQWAVAEAQAGVVRVLLARDLEDVTRVGARLVLIELRPGHPRCAIVERAPGRLASVRELHCEVDVEVMAEASAEASAEVMAEASAEGACDGWVEGAFRAISASGLIEGRFAAPLAVRAALDAPTDGLTDGPSGAGDCTEPECERD